MQNQQPLPKYVTIRPYLYPNKYLYIASDRSRATGQDFDVRVRDQLDQANYLILENLHANTYKISSYQNKNHIMFCSNDGVKGYQQDFDVRTHNSNEPRNNWIIEKVAWTTYTIRSETNQNHFLFYADDNSNAHKQEFDVRTHGQQTDNNLWMIDNFQVNVPEEQLGPLAPWVQIQIQVQQPQQPPHPQHQQPPYQAVQPQQPTGPTHTIRPSLNSTFYLHLSGHNLQFQGDMEVKVHNQQAPQNGFYIDRVNGNVFTIRPVQQPQMYLFIDNNQQINQWKDYNVRLHPFVEERNKWLIEKVGQKFLIRSFTNPEYYFFPIIEGQSPAFEVRAHNFAEERNQWFIDGFNG